MIAALHGKVEQVQGRQVTVDVHGVGYEVRCSGRALERCVPGQEVRLDVHTDVKQDSIRLYGFCDQLEKQVFLLLIEVQGVGCKSAAEILSQIDSRELLRVIGSGDESRLQALKGIGRKTAQRMVVELKDKVAAFAVERQLQPHVKTEQNEAGALEDAVEALQALGFIRKDAERAVQAACAAGGLKDVRDSGQIVKQALRYV